MDESIFKEKYQKYKLRVKVWEKDFKKKHGRVPSKVNLLEIICIKISLDFNGLPCCSMILGRLAKRYVILTRCITS